MNGKVNCWEFMRCGREPGGANVSELGVCIAATKAVVDGVHGGKNGGRTCWAVAGTFCGGKVQGTYASKYDTCTDCRFYMKIRREEGANFIHVLDILRLLGEEGKEES